MDETDPVRIKLTVYAVDGKGNEYLVGDETIEVPRAEWARLTPSDRDERCAEPAWELGNRCLRVSWEPLHAMVNDTRGAVRG